MAYASIRKRTNNRREHKFCVAAIDIGTTYSGCAFSFQNEYREDPTKVNFPTNWIACVGGLMSLKTPTALLLNPDQSFNSFGYEAEDNFLELTEDGKHHDYYYFRRFKMMLYEAKGLKRDMMIVDANYHSMKALTVFAISIKYFKEHIKSYIDSRVRGLTNDDIHWVLTVPALWNDSSKQFMREAAEAAGIKRENLDIALEPEVASLYCMHLPVGKMHLEGNFTDTERAAPFEKGTKYMVLDVGGSAVDITVYEVVGEGQLKELDHANGGEWDGSSVDASFEKFISQITGPEIFKNFKMNWPVDYIEISREFEAKKRTIQSDKTGKETIKIPIKLIEVYEQESQKKLKDRLKEMKLDEKVIYRTDKLRIDVDIVKSWFNDSCNKSVDHLKRLFNHKKNSGVNTILLVGGFSECQMLQDSLKANFSDKRIIIPEKAGLVVLKGAVLFGYNPLTVVSRIAVFGTDDTKGRESCFGGAAQSEKRYIPLMADHVSVGSDVYTSTEEEPVDCSYIGS